MSLLLIKVRFYSKRLFFEYERWHFFFYTNDCHILLMKHIFE
jgi:hypothetical protein